MKSHRKASLIPMLAAALACLVASPVVAACPPLPKDNCDKGPGGFDCNKEAAISLGEKLSELVAEPLTGARRDPQRLVCSPETIGCGLIHYIKIKEISRRLTNERYENWNSLGMIDEITNPVEEFNKLRTLYIARLMIDAKSDEDDRFLNGVGKLIKQDADRESPLPNEVGHAGRDGWLALKGRAVTKTVAESLPAAAVVATEDPKKSVSRGSPDYYCWQKYNMKDCRGTPKAPTCTAIARECAKLLGQ